MNATGIIELLIANVASGHRRVARKGNLKLFSLYKTRFHVIIKAPNPMPTNAKLKYPPSPKYSGSKNK
jgi:hypothetical protein